jgi:hypothetical protein
VLVPFSLAEHGRYLVEAGFSSAEPVCLWNNFVSLVAIR